MGGRVHTLEEIAWARRCIEEMPKGYSALSVFKAKYVEEYAAKFNRKMGVGGLVAWFRKIENPEGYKKYGKVSKDVNYAKLLKTLEQSALVLYVFNVGVFGFDTQAEVKDFLIKEVPKTPIKLFEVRPAQVKFKVEVEM